MAMREKNKKKKKPPDKAIKAMAISFPIHGRKSVVIAVCPRCVIDDTSLGSVFIVTTPTFILLLLVTIVLSRRS